MQRLLKRLAFIALFAFAIAGVAQAQNEATVFQAELSGGNVVPAVETDATGFAIAILLGDTLYVGGSFAGLSTPVAADIAGGVHIHNAAPGENGPVIFPIENSGGTTGSFSGTFTLDEAQLEALMNGNLYVQVHTEQHNPGELRGGLSAQMMN